jgi:RNA polymerase sigma factor (sigma-70 family)
MRDFEVTVKIRNNQLKKRRVQLGLNARQFAETAGVSYPEYIKLETLNASPVYTKDPFRGHRWIKGDWREIAVKIAEFYLCSPDELFPDSVLRVKKSEITVEFDLEQLPLAAALNEPALLPSPEDETFISETKAAIRKAVEALTPQEQTVLNAKFGLDHGKCLGRAETATLLGLSQGRISQIEANALKHIRSSIDLEVVPEKAQAEVRLTDEIDGHKNAAYWAENKAEKLERSMHYWLADAENLATRGRPFEVSVSKNKASEKRKEAARLRELAVSERAMAASKRVKLESL